MKVGLFSLEGEHPRSASAVARRFVLWTIVCWVSGGPSFAWASFSRQSSATGVGPFEPWAMALGIMLFAAGYTLLTSTDRFDAFQRRPGVRLTLYIGYFTRLGVSIAFPIAMGADLFPGMLSVLAISVLFENLQIQPGSSFAVDFVYTFLITCMQGAFLNILISIYMLVVYAFVRLSGKGMQQPRGFEVIPDALPMAQERTDPSREGSAH